jgi:RNase P/RNase MRP subunit p30
LRKEAAIAQDFHVPMVTSSGASSRFLIRTPRDLAALASVFDLDRTSALEAVSKNPVAIVKRNRHKLSAEFVAPGVRVVRRGKDCQKG